MEPEPSVAHRCAAQVVTFRGEVSLEDVSRGVSLSIGELSADLTKHLGAFKMEALSVISLPALGEWCSLLITVVGRPAP